MQGHRREEKALSSDTPGLGAVEVLSQVRVAA